MDARAEHAFAMTIDVRQFPWDSLERTSRADIAATSSLRRLLRSQTMIASVGHALSELTGEGVEVLRGRTQAGASAMGEDAVGVAVGFADTGGLLHAAVVCLESALAAGLVARALKHRAPRLTVGTTPSAELVGAAAAVVLAALRRAFPSTALRIVSAGPARVLSRDLARLSPELATAHLTIGLGRDAFDARVVVASSTSRALVDATGREDMLGKLGDVRLSVPVVLTTSLAAHRDVSLLRPGDAFVPGTLALTTDTEGHLLGPVVLASARGERGLAAELADQRRLVVRQRLVDEPWDAAFLCSLHGLSRERTNSPSDLSTMPDNTKSAATASVLEEAPVVVRVELGSVELPAREWAELGEGDVITLGRKLGAPALLRVGGVEVARGELVQVEGEYGVRILSVRGGGP